MSKQNRGFTLLELLVVIVIIGLRCGGARGL
jgi:prepilin-type N-terminal cleavage/methylation domain-containing protein